MWKKPHNSAQNDGMCVLESSLESKFYPVHVRKRMFMKSQLPGVWGPISLFGCLGPTSLFKDISMTLIHVMLRIRKYHIEFIFRYSYYYNVLAAFS